MSSYEISNKSNNNSGNYNNENNAGVIGQIIFDINGEYANANLQDEGTAIFELFQKDVIRYSVLNKEDFKVMKVNFYNDIESGFELIRSHFTDSSDYVNSFKAIDWSEPESNDHSAITRYERKKVAYLCCLYKEIVGKVPKKRLN